MRAGTMRKRLTFQKKTETRNSFNEAVVSYVDHVTVWGSVTPNAGRKVYEALQANSEISGEIRIRYRSDIEPTMRIKLGSRYLEIISIVNVQERNRELLVYYKTGLD
jgi:SPP1 family predicted phage head-tail adaptor